VTSSTKEAVKSFGYALGDLFEAGAYFTRAAEEAVSGGAGQIAAEVLDAVGAHETAEKARSTASVFQKAASRDLGAAERELTEVKDNLAGGDTPEKPVEDTPAGSPPQPGGRTRSQVAKITIGVVPLSKQNPAAYGVNFGFETAEPIDNASVEVELFDGAGFRFFSHSFRANGHAGQWGETLRTTPREVKESEGHQGEDWGTFTMSIFDGDHRSRGETHGNFPLFAS
jgi:hypothetical protein